MGSAVAEALRKRGDTVFATSRYITTLPEGINYAVFAQRYRGPADPCGEWLTSVMLTDRIMNELGWADEGDTAAVIVSSIVGVEADARHPVAYQCAKAAQVHLAHHLSRKLGIRVNVVAPGAFTGPDKVVDIADVVETIELLCRPSMVNEAVFIKRGGYPTPTNGSRSAPAPPTEV